MNPGSIRQSVETLAAVLDDIDAGKLDASGDQRAYLSGALDTLRTLLTN